MRVIWKGKDRCQGDEVFELSEGQLFSLTPPPRLVLLHEIKEWSYMVGEVLDEPSLEISEAKEGLHLFSVLRLQPFCHSLNFDWIHLCLAFRDDET